MVQNMLPIEQYGFYAMAALVITALNTIATTGGIAIVPSLSVAREAGDRDLFGRQIRNTARLGFLVLVPVVSLIFVLSRDFFSLALPRFVPSVPTIRILCFVGFVLIFSRMAWATLVAYGKGIAASSSYVVAVLWNVFWNWMLIPRYGIAGAAAATLSTFILLAAVLQLVMWRVSRIWVGVSNCVYAIAVSLVFPIVWLLLWVAGAGPLARILIVAVAGSALFAVLTITAGLVRGEDLSKAAAALEPRAGVPHVRITLGLVEILQKISRLIGVGR
jgi:O-antigen/teichoic acid export membrane protein